MIEEEEYIAEEDYVEEEQVVTDDDDDDDDGGYSDSKSSQKNRSGRLNTQTRVKRRRVFRIARSMERQRGKKVSIFVKATHYISKQKFNNSCNFFFCS